MGCAAAAVHGGTRITLEATHDHTLPALVEGDRHRVAQVRCRWRCRCQRRVAVLSAASDAFLARI
jgi:hypothetical protein